jgi:hypothetical protein
VFGYSHLRNPRFIVHAPGVASDWHVAAMLQLPPGATGVRFYAKRCKHLRVYYHYLPSYNNSWGMLFFGSRQQQRTL